MPQKSIFKHFLNYFSQYNRISKIACSGKIHHMLSAFLFELRMFRFHNQYELS